MVFDNRLIVGGGKNRFRRKLRDRSSILHTIFVKGKPSEDELFGGDRSKVDLSGGVRVGENKLENEQDRLETGVNRTILETKDETNVDSVIFLRVQRIIKSGSGFADTAGRRADFDAAELYHKFPGRHP